MVIHEHTANQPVFLCASPGRGMSDKKPSFTRMRGAKGALGVPVRPVPVAVSGLDPPESESRRDGRERASNSLSTRSRC